MNSEKKKKGHVARKKRGKLGSRIDLAKLFTAFTEKATLLGNAKAFVLTAVTRTYLYSSAPSCFSRALRLLSSSLSLSLEVVSHAVWKKNSKSIMSPLFFNGPFAANRQMVQDSQQMTLWEPLFPTPSHCLLSSVANFLPYDGLLPKTHSPSKKEECPFSVRGRKFHPGAMTSVSRAHA